MQRAMRAQAGPPVRFSERGRRPAAVAWRFAAVLLAAGLQLAACGTTTADAGAESDGAGTGNGASNKGEAAAGPATSANAACGPAEGVVSGVIDGDTVELSTGERVRYLLVDTPEITGGKDECFGDEARRLNEQLVAGQPVRFVYDEECADRYGRILAYVWVDGREVNRVLVERGFACVLHIPPNGGGRVADFRDWEAAAETAGAGMWGSCEEVACVD